MLPDLQNLMELQVADREILRLKEEVAALPKRVQIIEHKLADTKGRLEKAKAAVKADEAAKKRYESAIQDLQGRISKYRDQSLEVKTNDQYRALLHEIEFAQKEIASHEDKILELMLDADARDREVKTAEAELKAETAEIEKEKAEAHRLSAEDEKQLALWNAKRDRVRAAIDADVLRHYDRVFKFRGSGISEVRDQKCLACQVMLRPQTYNEVRAGTSLVFCDSCQRVLYVVPEHDTPVERPAVARKRRARPKPDAPQVWFYHPCFGQSGEVFMGYSNGMGSSTRRVFEVHTGRQVGDTLTREGNYRLAFPEDLHDVIRLNGNWSDEEMDSWNAEMPMLALDALQSDLEAARAEAQSARPAATEAPASEHPAAS
jgi:predicted  nucleic acid-binding Zn-ribbon protein